MLQLKFHQEQHAQHFLQQQNVHKDVKSKSTHYTEWPLNGQ